MSFDASNGTQKSWFEVNEEGKREEEEERQKLKKDNATLSTTKSSLLSNSQDEVFNLEAMQKNEDPKNPLYSKYNSFEEFGLPKEILEGIHSLKFNRPSKIQGLTIPVIMGEKKTNIIAQSQSGTGKTLCFAIGMLLQVTPDLQEPQCLCVLPTLELAKQTYDTVIALAKYTKIQVEGVFKGAQYTQPLHQQIIIGTPGKLWDLLMKKKLSPKNIRLFVLDEADVMLSSQQEALKEQAVKIKNQLNPKQTRIFLFSATFQEGKEDEKGAKKDKEVLEFAHSIIPNPLKEILIPKEELSLKQIKQYYIRIPLEKIIPQKELEKANQILVTSHDEEASVKDPQLHQKILNAKYDLLMDLFKNLEGIGQCIIFMNRIEDARMLSERLRTGEKVSFSISLLHGKMESVERKRIIEEFQKSNTKVLITTNVLARGIDVYQVTHVINFDLPTTRDGKADPSTYLHRIGRSGRFGKKGCAINFVTNNAELAVLKEIATYYDKEIIEVNRDDDFDAKIK